MYEGALRMAHMLLDHHPQVKARVADALKKAATEPNPQRCFTLREAIEEVRKVASPMKAVAGKTLWDRLGGEAGVRKIVQQVAKEAGEDPKVNVSRGGKVEVKPDKLVDMIVSFISSQTGGPLKYTGKPLKEAHKGMQITDAEFDALMGHIEKALRDNKVPAKDADEFMKNVRSTRADVVEVKGTGAAPTPPPMNTLWNRLGGETAVVSVVHDLVAAAAKDPKVNFDRGGKYKLDDAGVTKLEKQLVDFVSSVTGGPRKYTGKDMKTVHAGMKITEAEFNALATDLVDVLKKHNVAQKEIDELITLVASTKKDIVEK
jgi:hemoglobin